MVAVAKLVLDGKSITDGVEVYRPRQSCGRCCRQADQGRQDHADQQRNHRRADRRWALGTHRPKPAFLEVAFPTFPARERDAERSNSLTNSRTDPEPNGLITGRTLGDFPGNVRYFEAFRWRACASRCRSDARGRRGTLPCRRKRLRQVDPYQDHFRSRGAGTRRPDRHFRYGIPQTGSGPFHARGHSGHLSGPFAVSQPQRRRKHCDGASSWWLAQGRLAAMRATAMAAMAKVGTNSIRKPRSPISHCRASARRDLPCAGGGCQAADHG